MRSSAASGSVRSADRGGRVAAMNRVQRHALGPQRVQQPVAQLAVGHAAQERHRVSHAREAERHVQRRAADARVERDAGGRRRAGEHIHQGFARDHVHGDFLFS
jgi:hypothetical protein